MELIKLGIGGLDSLIGGLRRGSLVLIYGRPGSGKTVMATSICYKNMLDGRRAYYVSLYEDKEKFYEFIKALGIDLRSFEDKGLFRYVRIPLIISDAIRNLAEQLVKGILEFKPDVTVIDSITPLLEAVRDETLARALLHNFVYELPKLTNGIVVLIAEAGGSKLDKLLSMAYVADVVIELSYKLDDYLVREMIVHKVRGTGISQAKIPFTIVPGSGIVVWIFPRLEEIPPPDYSKVCKVACEVLNNAIGKYLYGGWNIFITYDPDLRPYEVISYILLNVLMNRSKTLVISYKFAPNDVLNMVKRLVSTYYGRDVDIEKPLSEYVILKGFNPGSLSIEELYPLELNLISELKPDVVMFVGIDIPAYYYGLRLFRYIHNQVLYLRKLGIISFRLGSYISKRFYRMNATLADIVVRILLDKESLKLKLYLWGRGLRPSLIGFDELRQCFREFITSIPITET